MLLSATTMSLPLRRLRALLPLVLTAVLALASGLRADPVISEFLAANAKTLADNDGKFSDWIEVFNPDAAPVNLAGWYLTDSATTKTKWQFPSVTVAVGGYLIVWASNENRRDPTKPLHTNFTLDADGSYLALIKPDGTTIGTEFAPKYPAQLDDVSYGVTQPAAASEAARRGHFRTPTPGARNGNADTLLLTERIIFSRASGPFTGTFALTLTGATAGQKIRYLVTVPTAAGAVVKDPDATSPEYTGPITVAASTIVRVMLFATDSLATGYATSAHYMRLANTGTARLDNFSSQLPLLVIDTHGTGPLEKDGTQKPGWYYSWTKPAAGGTTLTVPPSVTSPLSTNVRGSSSADFPKKGYAVRFLNNLGKIDSHSPFGLDTADEWVLNGPWKYDPTYLHNVFIYDLSNRIGRWAPRTQLVEVFFNSDGGDLDYNDYAGVYIFTDALRVDSNRVDITAIDPKDLTGSSITGGYFLKFDVGDDADEFNFQTTRNFPGLPNAVIVTSPKIRDLPQAQRDYIKGYVQSFEDALYADRDGGWQKRTHLDFVDREAWIDYHIISVLSMNVDGLKRSTYMTKDRRGRLTSGPVWDYDRALAGGDNRAQIADIWSGLADATDFWNYGWWGVIARDPEFRQAWVERWQKLRKNEFSTANMSARIDKFAAEIGPLAGARDAARWPDNASRFPGGWQGEVDNLKSWLAKRTAWIDSQFSGEPTLTIANGTLNLTPAPGTQVAYTLDGSDPRLLGGGLSGSAVLSSARVTLSDAAVLRARGYRAGVDPNAVPGSPWSTAVGTAGRLINLSILTALNARESFTMGFVVGGDGTSGAKPLLARAAGPSLAQLGVTAFLPDPTMSLISTSNSPATTVATNNDWNGTAALNTAFASVGAFAYTAPTSKDAAIFQTGLAPGNYTVQVNDTGAGTGTVIAELYDATALATFGVATPRLINVSVLKNLGTGLTAGFVIFGGSPRTVLIRSIGPTLGAAPFNVAGTVSDPQLTLNGASGKITDNDDWGGGSALAAAFKSVGAFALPDGSRDAALLATLAPGNYTVEVKGSGDKTGVALVEIYEVP
ncbi:MAG: hypothetical protein EXS37_11990 [Opitutus sp.]|nr:hypothetical protein [Opitutus sp.]